jgi:hypothetical protein
VLCVPFSHLNLISLRPILVGTAAYFLSTQALYSDINSKSKLIHSLESMGYEKVSLDNCELSLRRSVVPTENNNGFYSYERYENLNWLSSFSSSEIEIVNSKGRQYYRLTANYEDELPMSLHAKNSVWLQISIEIDGADWPHKHPSKQNELTSAVERRAKELLPQLSQMSRWVTYSNSGEATIPQWNFEFNYSSLPSLEYFKQAIIDYASKTGCEIEH